MLSACAASEITGPAALPWTTLKRALAAHLERPPRRIDRLAALALLGALPLRAQVHARCGLYLSSHYPASDTIGHLLEAVCVQRSHAKPLNFVNSVSNAAGFHLAGLLGLDGPNLFIGAGPGVWRHLQYLALTDLASGHCTQALLICIDEPHASSARTMQAPGACRKTRIQSALVQAAPAAPMAGDFATLTAALAVQRIELPMECPPDGLPPAPGGQLAQQAALPGGNRL